MNCKFSKRVDGKIERIPPETFAETNFTGIYVLKIADFLSGAVKTIRLIPQEFLVKKIEAEMTYFDHWVNDLTFWFS